MECERLTSPMSEADTSAYASASASQNEVLISNGATATTSGVVESDGQAPRGCVGGLAGVRGGCPQNRQRALRPSTSVVRALFVFSSGTTCVAPFDFADVENARPHTKLTGRVDHASLLGDARRGITHHDENALLGARAIALQSR